jgi:hypothetical protein
MRQIHAAIEHLQRGDFECAMTLAAAGEGMLPPTDEPHFRELARMTEVNDIVDWLRHGPMKDKENRRRVNERRARARLTAIALHLWPAKLAIEALRDRR